MSRSILVAALLVAACNRATPAAPARPAVPATPSVEDLVRVRCSTDGADVITTWRGTVYAYVPDQAPRLLFRVVGMNVARCSRDAGGWMFSSRELMLYLDPDSGEVLQRWTNPWTGAEVPVVHVANDPVQHRLAGSPEPERRGDDATYVIEVGPAYPNPLAADPELRRFSPQATYAALELFTLTAPAAELGDPQRAMVSRMSLTWHRVGPWLPWMDMGEQRGHLVYSARGQRVDRLADLPVALRAELDERVPLYRRAPRCWLDRPNETSWTYFARHLEAYQAGARFPMSAPDTPDPCR
jgi:hypothetical protein